MASWEYFWEGFCLFWKGMVEFFTSGIALRLMIAIVAIVALIVVYFVPTLLLGNLRRRIRKKEEQKLKRVCLLVLTVLAQIALMLAEMATVFAVTRDIAATGFTLIVELLFLYISYIWHAKSQF